MGTWPHAPSRLIDGPGRYMITASTYKKIKLYNTAEKLDLLESILLGSLDQLGWNVQAWAVFPNHYHFVGFSPDEGLGLTELTRQIHKCSARDLNRIDGCEGRRVWFRSWDTKLTYDRSYLARLAYVHQNAVKHRLVMSPDQYKWCSAKWFRDGAERAFYETVMSFKIDQLRVIDDF